MQLQAYSFKGASLRLNSKSIVGSPKQKIYLRKLCLELKSHRFSKNKNKGWDPCAQPVWPLPVQIWDRIHQLCWGRERCLLSLFFFENLESDASGRLDNLGMILNLLLDFILKRLFCCRLLLMMMIMTIKQQVSIVLGGWVGLLCMVEESKV